MLFHYLFKAYMVFLVNACLHCYRRAGPQHPRINSRSVSGSAAGVQWPEAKQPQYGAHLPHRPPPIASR